MAESCFDMTCRCPEILPLDLMTSMNGRIIHTNHAWILPFDLITSMDGRIVKRSGGKAVPVRTCELANSRTNRKRAANNILFSTVSSILSRVSGSKMTFGRFPLTCPPRPCHNPYMSNLIQHTTELAMHIAAGYVKPGDIVIDATCGNGHDSLRLAEMRPGHLYAFDLQPDAVRKTRELLEREGFGEELAPGGSITVTCLGHEHMTEFFREQGLCGNTGPEDRSAGPAAPGFASVILFNLGYLPGGDKQLTTRAETTLEAAKAGQLLLKKDGLLCITMYSGHPEGAEEKRALLAFAEGLDSKCWHVGFVRMLNQKNDPPEILLISRKR